MSEQTETDPKIVDHAQYSRCYEVAGPHWPDICGHGGYIGTIWPFVGTDRQIVDVYVFSDKFKEGMSITSQTLCLRYGPEGSEYYSPGEISNLIQHAASLAEYGAALRLLQSRGHIVWTPHDAGRIPEPTP